MVLQCVACERDFEAQRSTAKYCGPTCRQRAKRSPTGKHGKGLVASVRRDLEAAGVVDKYHGQLAIELARQMTAAGATGISSLSKELRVVMDVALAGVAPKSGEGAVEEDEVAKARQARERKTRNAAG